MKERQNGNFNAPSPKSRNNNHIMLSMNLSSRPSSNVTSQIFQHPSLQAISNSNQPAPSRNDIYKPCHCQSVPSMCVCEPAESCHEQSSLSTAFAMKLPAAWHCKTVPSTCVCEPREPCHEQNSFSRAFEMTHPMSHHPRPETIASCY